MYLDIISRIIKLRIALKICVWKNQVVIFSKYEPIHRKLNKLSPLTTSQLIPPCSNKLAPKHLNSSFCRYFFFCIILTNRGGDFEVGKLNRRAEHLKGPCHLIKFFHIWSIWTPWVLNILRQNSSEFFNPPKNALKVQFSVLNRAECQISVN